MDPLAVRGMRVWIERRYDRVDFEETQLRRAAGPGCIGATQKRETLVQIVHCMHNPDRRMPVVLLVAVGMRVRMGIDVRADNMPVPVRAGRRPGHDHLRDGLLLELLGARLLDGRLLLDCGLLLVVLVMMVVVVMR
jgi:hypothetical protein